MRKALGQRVLVDLMDLSPHDLDHAHVINVRPSISLVKSDDCDLISQSADDRATRDCLWTLR